MNQSSISFPLRLPLINMKAYFVFSYLSIETEPEQDVIGSWLDAQDISKRGHNDSVLIYLIWNTCLVSLSFVSMTEREYSYDF